MNPLRSGTWCRRLLVATAVVASAATLGLEVALPRLLAPVFGSAHAVWTSVIAVVLSALAGGAFVAGRVVATRDLAEPFFMLTTCAGAAIVALPTYARCLLPLAVDTCAAWRLPMVCGILVSVAVLCGPALVCLGALPPLALRACVRQVGDVTRVAGWLSGLSTIGGLAGVLVVAFLLVPAHGVRHTVGVLGSALCAFGLAGSLWSRATARSTITSVCLTVGGVGSGLWHNPAADAPRLLAERDSVYAHLEVREVGAEPSRFPPGTRLLFADGGRALQSVRLPTPAVPAGYWSWLLTAPFFNEVPAVPRVMCVIGLGGGTVLTAARFLFGEQLIVEGAEPDADLMALARAYLGTEQARLIVPLDGRAALRHLHGPYDIVVVDAFQGSTYPPELATRQFFTQVVDRLTETGSVALNIVVDPSEPAVAAGIAASLQSTVASVHALHVPGTRNLVLVGTRARTRASRLGEHAARLAEASPQLAALLRAAAAHIVPTPAGEAALDDDDGRLEALQARVLWRRPEPRAR